MFTEVFPVFYNHSTIIAGENYGGKFVPKFTCDLLKNYVKHGYNLQIIGAFMGDPYIVPLI